MKIVNKINNSFGPVGSFAGIFIAIIGIAMSFYSLAAILLVIFGLFVGFSSIKTCINTEDKKIRFCFSPFGIFNLGKWKKIVPGMKLGITKYNAIYRTYSRSNRILDLKSDDYFIYLYGSDNKPVLPLKRTGNIESAREEMEGLSKLLNLEVLK